MNRSLVIVIDIHDQSDPQRDVSRAGLPQVEWPSDLEVQSYLDRYEAMAGFQRHIDNGRPPAAVVIAGDPQPVLRTARQVFSQDPMVQMILVADREGDQRLRQEMGLAPRIGTNWSIVHSDAGELPQRLNAAVRSTHQRRQLRTTLDRARLQVAASPPPPADGADYRRLVLSDRYLAAILTHAHDAILSTDSDGKILTANPATERLTGYAEHELLSRCLPELVLEQERSEVERLLQEVHEGVSEVRREMQVRTRDDNLLDVDIMLAPVRDERGQLFGISAVLRDISERKRADRAMQEQQEWLQVTLSSIGDAVIATDTEGRATFLNPVAESLTGWPQQEAAGKPLETIFRIINEHTREPVDNPVSKVLREGVTVGLANHTILVARDNSERPIDDSAAPIRDREGRMLGVVLVFHDISERRKIERELQERTDRLAESDRRKDEFLALLGHELRNPLSPLRNGLDVLAMHDHTDVQLTREIYAMMGRQVDQLVHLVDDLLDVSRISRGILKLRRERVELGELARRAVETTRSGIEQRRHELTVQLPDQPVWLDADPVRIEQVLCNLLTNAARYTEPGGHVRLVAERDGNWASIRVSDTGIGIRPEMLAHIFDIFTQADRVEGNIHEGLGLGLTLVKSLTDMHGGQVDVRSDGPGEGSEFIVRFPALVETTKASDGNVAESAASQKEPLRVLVVDDNQDAAQSLAMLLQLAGHEVRTANDGASALELVRSYDPELIFLDIGLPHGMNGYEVAQRLRQQPFHPRPLLVALTGFGQESDRQSAKEAGFDEHLIKPAKADAVHELAARAAEARKTSR